MLSKFGPLLWWLGWVGLLGVFVNLLGCGICHGLHLGENPFHLPGGQSPVCAYLDELGHVDNRSVEWRDDTEARTLRFLFGFGAEIFPVLQRHLHNQSPRLSPLFGTLNEVGAKNSSRDSGKSADGSAYEGASGGIGWHSLAKVLGVLFGLFRR